MVTSKSRWWEWGAFIIAALGFLIQLKLSYSGVYLVDSQDQLDQALSGNFNDWHPPAMAYFWRVLIWLTGTPTSMYLFQVACYWLGIGLISDGLLRSRNLKSGLAVLIIGLCPFYLYVNTLVVKDAQMSAAFLASFGLIFRFRNLDRRIPLPVGVLAVVLLVYGVLARANGSFAIAPLVLYFFCSSRQFGSAKTILFGCVVTLAALSLASVINGHVLSAHRTAPIRSLQLFDIVGVAKYSGDIRWTTPLLSISAADLDACYTPYWWDSIAPWGSCPDIAGTVMNKDFKKITSDRDIYPASAKLTTLWLSSIAYHPLAYAEHRIKHFNAVLNFFVPALERRFGLLFYAKSLTSQDIRQDYVKKSFITWPAPWLALAICTLISLRNVVRDHIVSAARILSMSGLLYGAAYLIIGVASEPRYMYWTMLSSGLAAAIGFSSIFKRIRAGDRPAFWSALSIPMVIILGMTSRLLDLQFMLH